ncbi:MAG: acetylxylan esterase [Clostridia bacterium]|nr:acetylxylan esterase [Clostridia bacterium]
MPQLDMPLAKLQEYMGRTPCPADFDAFWEKAMAEMNAIDPKPVLTPHPYKSAYADLYELRFTSTKGAVIFGKVAVPKNLQGKVPAILKFHGLGGDGGSYKSLLADASQGYVVASMDCRGQAGLSQDVGVPTVGTMLTPFVRGLDGDPHNLLCRDLFLDTAMFARIIMGLDYVDETRVGCTGGSQGGALTVACAALVPSIKLCAPIHPYLSDYKRVWEMDLAKDAYEGLRAYFRHYDPRHEHEEEIFTKLGYIDIQNLAPRIRAKVLWATGLMDNICPPSSQFAAYNKLTCEKEMKIYPDYKHESLRGHDDIIFDFMAQL